MKNSIDFKKNIKIMDTKQISLMDMTFKGVTLRVLLPLVSNAINTIRQDIDRFYKKEEAKHLLLKLWSKWTKFRLQLVLLDDIQESNKGLYEKLQSLVKRFEVFKKKRKLTNDIRGWIMRLTSKGWEVNIEAFCEILDDSKSILRSYKTKTLKEVILAKSLPVGMRRAWIMTAGAEEIASVSKLLWFLLIQNPKGFNILNDSLVEKEIKKSIKGKQIDVFEFVALTRGTQGLIPLLAKFLPPKYLTNDTSFRVRDLLRVIIKPFDVYADHIQFSRYPPLLIQSETWKSIQKEISCTTLKIVTVGGTNSGKSTLINVICRKRLLSCGPCANHTNDIIPVQSNSKETKLCITSQEEYREVRGAIAIYDTLDKRRQEINEGKNLDEDYVIKTSIGALALSSAESGVHIEIIDCPGTGGNFTVDSIPKMIEWAAEKADVLLVVLTGEDINTKNTEKILTLVSRLQERTRHNGRVICVVNKKDRLMSYEKDSCVAHAVQFLCSVEPDIIKEEDVVVISAGLAQTYLILKGEFGPVPKKVLKQASEEFNHFFRRGPYDKTNQEHNKKLDCMWKKSNFDALESSLMTNISNNRAWLLLLKQITSMLDRVTRTQPLIRILDIWDKLSKHEQKEAKLKLKQVVVSCRPYIMKVTTDVVKYIEKQLKAKKKKTEFDEYDFTQLSIFTKLFQRIPDHVLRKTFESLGAEFENDEYLLSDIDVYTVLEKSFSSGGWISYLLKKTNTKIMCKTLCNLAEQTLMSFIPSRRKYNVAVDLSDSKKNLIALLDQVSQGAS